MIEHNTRQFTESDAIRGDAEERSKAYSGSTVSSTGGGNEVVRRLCKL